MHPAIAQVLGADLGERAFGNGEIFVLLKPKRTAVRMAALQDVVAGTNGKDERAFLLHEGDALGAGAHVEAASLETVEIDAAGKRSDAAGNQVRADPLLFMVFLGLLGWYCQGVSEFELYVPALAWSAFLLAGALVGVPRTRGGENT